MIRQVIKKTCLMMVLLLCGAGTALATSIEYQLTNTGGNSYECTFEVGDFDFDAGYGFSIYFSDALYDNLTIESDSVAWEESLFTPLFPGDDYIFDVYALTDDALSVDSEFTVSFDWLGGGLPGDQYFEVYHDDFPDFVLLEVGETTAVPEPATLLLFGSGLLGAAGLRRKKRGQ